MEEETTKFDMEEEETTKFEAFLDSLPVWFLPAAFIFILAVSYVIFG